LDNSLHTCNIRLSQPENGYRSSMDAFLLAAHVQPEAKEKIIDIGCGCAVISIMVAKKSDNLEITGIEIQKTLADYARKNVRNNGLEHCINIIHKDINKIHASDTGGKADIIVSNPPYKKKGSGRINPDHGKAVARHEISLDINQLAQCSARLLKTRGRIYVIFPAERICDLFNAMTACKFSITGIRFVHIRKHEPAKRVIICAEKNNAGQCIVMPPLFVFEQKNKYSDEYVSLFKP